MLFFWVLLVVVVGKLVGAIGKGNITELLWYFYTSIAPGKSFNDLRQTQRKAIDVHTQRANTSSKDEFAKWAKLDREYATIKADIERHTAQIESSKSTFGKIVKAALFLATTGAKLYLRVAYRKVPMLFLPPNTLPYPVLWVLSFSSAPINSVSVSSWLFICDWALSALQSILSLVYTRSRSKPQQPPSTEDAQASPRKTPVSI